MMAVDINEKTKIPFAWMIAVSAFLATSGAGGVGWLTTMHSDISQAKKDLVEQKTEQKEFQREVIKVLRRLERSQIKMQEKLKILPESESE